MPPKKTTEASEDITEMFKLLSSQIASISTRLDSVVTVDVLNKKIGELEATIQHFAEENQALKSDVTKKGEQILKLENTVSNLQDKLNGLEQHHRSWSLRVANLPLTSEEENDINAIRTKLYTHVFLPILRGAHENGDIPEIPTADRLIEMAHTLPAKAGLHKPVIVRFYSREMRTACLRHKKAHAPRKAPGPDGRRDFVFPFFEDLTRDNFNQLQAFKKSARTSAVWTINGQIRYRIVDSTTVKKVTSLSDTP